MRYGYSDRQNLNHLVRLQAVLSILRAESVLEVLDLGCGDGQLIEMLVPESRLKTIVGIDPSIEAIKLADSLVSDGRVTFLHGDVDSLKQKFQHTSAVVMTEVIEHLEPEILASTSHRLFGWLKPDLVILTTPHAPSHMRLPAARLHELGHWFEWDKSEFEAWSTGIATKYGYSVDIDLITGPTFTRGSMIGTFRRYTPPNQGKIGNF